MLDDLAPRRRRTVLAAVGVAVAASLVATGTVVVRSIDTSEPVAQDRPGPVLLVPGYGGRTASLEPLADTLREQGRDVVVVEAEDGGVGDLRAAADALGEAAEAAIERTGADSVDVVGYSAGGVVARLWVRDGSGADLARRVLTLGSPHHGTALVALALAFAGTCPEACRQLAPDSGLLRALNAGDETPDGPEWITVRTRADGVVVPTDSALLDGALNLEVQTFCPDASTTHGDLPGDPVTLATAAAVLGVDAPRAPTGVSC